MRRLSRWLGRNGAAVVVLVVMLLRDRRRKDGAENPGLGEAEQRLRTLIDSSSDVVIVAARDSTVRYEAGPIRTVLGREPDQLHGGRLADLVEPDDAPVVLSLCAGSTESAEVRIRHRNGELRTHEVRATNLADDPLWRGVVLHIWDVSDRLSLERDLRLAQKLEAVGQLAAGIAHEINTPIQYLADTSRFLDNSFAEMLAVFDAYSELLEAAQRGSISDELVARVEEATEIADLAYLRDRVPKACERSVDGVESVAKIVSAMRAFAHPASPYPTPVDINEAIRNVLTISTNEYKYVADVHTELGEVPPVVCMAGDINQVLLNLIINAAHAIADVVGDSRRRGSITVRTEQDGGDVVISVEDDGGGIPREVTDRIFDPFFTTKEVGRGTGQGLALSRMIVVERHRGTLTFKSSVGDGSTFYVRLPIVPAADTWAPGDQSAPAEAA